MVLDSTIASNTLAKFTVKVFPHHIQALLSSVKKGDKKHDILKIAPLIAKYADLLVVEAAIMVSQAEHMMKVTEKTFIDTLKDDLHSGKVLKVDDFLGLCHLFYRVFQNPPPP